MDEPILIKLLTGAVAALAAMGAYIWRALHVKIDSKARASDLLSVAKKIDEHEQGCREMWAENRDVHRRIFDKMDDTNKSLNILVGVVQSIDRKVP